MRHLHLFNDFNIEVNKYFNLNGNTHKNPWVSYAKDKKRVRYNEPGFLSTPLTFEIVESGEIKWSNTSGLIDRVNPIEYSINGGEWVELAKPEGQATSISVTTGDIVRFRGDNVGYGSNYEDVHEPGHEQWTESARYYSFKGTTCGFIVYGNVMSLINKTSFEKLNTIPGSFAFENMFRDCTGLISAEYMLLPATTLSNGCYHAMFMGCSNMLYTPKELPATVLSLRPYTYMFSNCSSIKTTPIIRGVELTDIYMNNGCYGRMFENCSSLESIICLAEDITTYQTSDPTDNLFCWVNGVQTTSGTFYKSPNMSNWPVGTSSNSYHGVPQNWTVVNYT